MDIQAIDSMDSVRTLEKLRAESQPEKPVLPAANNVQAFDQAMKSDDTSAVSSVNNHAGRNGSDGTAGVDNAQLKDLLVELIKLVQDMLTQLANEKTEGGSTAGPSSNVIPVAGNGSGGSAGSDSGLIPKPTEHIQQLNLGGKTVTVGGDGSASAEEVAATAQSIEQLYQDSPTFKNMIDTSSDSGFEVSVGRRDDNTSWGNTGGRVFMNINNIEPGNSDTFQGLLGHEFAHASIDIGHGTQMEQIEDAVAREA